jgi:hypothetical protein
MQAGIFRTPLTYNKWRSKRLLAAVRNLPVETFEAQRDQSAVLPRLKDPCLRAAKPDVGESVAIMGALALLGSLSALISSRNLQPVRV